ncbi:ABC transporter substrate-binding protein [Hoeflea sp. CAU 1731]
MSILMRMLGAASVAAITLVSQLSHADDGSLVIVSTQVPRHLNAAFQSGSATAVPSAQIFASPLRYDENWEPQPYLAKSWEFSEDGLSLTLNLVDNATFHDGEPITSEDVAFSIMAIKENHPFKSMFAPVDRVETPDEHTAIIKLNSTHPALLLSLSPILAPIMPKHVYGDGQDLKSHPANSSPVGSGPFMLESFVPGDAIVLKKNPDYFIEGRPRLDEIIIRSIQDPAALLIAMENGDADMYPFMAGSQEIRRLEKVDSLNVTSEGYDAVGPINWLAFNLASDKLSDVRVRRAIAYAIDRDFITQALHRGVSTPQTGPIARTSPYFEEKVEKYDVDLERAKALMEEAGYADGMDLTIDYIPGPREQHQNVAEYLKSQLKKIGINLTVRAAPDFATFAGRVGSHDFELTMDILFNWGDPVIGVHRSYLTNNIRKGVIWSNTQSYSNPKVDELLNAAAVELDVDKRKALYSEFQKIVTDDLPVYWINALPYRTAYKQTLMNVPNGIWGTMHPMDTVEWSK